MVTASSSSAPIRRRSTSKSIGGNSASSSSSSSSDSVLPAVSSVVSREHSGSSSNNNAESLEALMKTTTTTTTTKATTTATTSAGFVVFDGFLHLFFRRRFFVHRILGLLYLIQLSVAVFLYETNYQNGYLNSPLPWSVPLNAVLQSTNAALTFRFLPKREDPGFSALSDKSVLSYYTVAENSFYALQLLFACCVLQPSIRKTIIQRRFITIVVEPIMTFFPFFLRHLWPKSSVSASLQNSHKNRSDENRFMLTVSTHAIRLFILGAKHFVGFFPIYIVFMSNREDDDEEGSHDDDDEPQSRRLPEETRRLLFGIQLLSSYASTVSIFTHTLRFKGYIGPTMAMVLYDIIIPGFAYLLYNLYRSGVMERNADLAMCCTVGMLLNLWPSLYKFSSSKTTTTTTTTKTRRHPPTLLSGFELRPWFLWQVLVCYLCYTKQTHLVLTVVDPHITVGVLVVAGAFWFRR